MSINDNTSRVPVTIRFVRRLIKIAPIYLGIMVIVLNDWRLGQFSFSDLFIIVGIMILASSIIRVPVRWLIGWASILFLVMINIIIASSVGDYSLVTGIFYLAKIGMYILFYILLYQYVMKHHMALDFLNALINVALVVSLIGMYISLIIANDLSMPYDFLWTFTRQDIASYIFAGGYSSVVRVRSIFGEPQHLGLFLNITLAAVLIGNYNERINRHKSLLVIALAAITTFSFSTIPVTLVIFFLYFVRKYRMSFILKKNFAIFLGMVIGLAVLVWQAISETIIKRGALILNGGDGSAYQRLQGSWSNINMDNILFGSGVGQSPYAWNNYAYLLTDFGIIGLVLIMLLTYYLLKRNIMVGSLFAIFCFQKGGYLSGFFLMMLFIMFIATSSWEKSDKYGLKLHSKVAVSKSI